MPDKFDELENEILQRMRKIYSDKVIDHAMNPRNTEQVSHPDGFGSATSGCGEVMEIRIKVKDSKIVDASFWTNGCSTTVACGSMASELIKGENISRALAITQDDILRALDGLPEGNKHCALLSANTVRAAALDCMAIRKEPWKKVYRKC